MKIYFLIILFILIFINSFAQKGSSSYLYNEKCQLRLDTMLTISRQQYAIWRMAEINLMAAFSQIEFPQILLENSIKPKKILIASFECDTSDIKNVEVVNDTGWYALAVVKGLQKQGKFITRILKDDSKKVSNSIYTGKYYTAISFTMIDFYEEAKIQKAVPIIKGSIPIIDVASPGSTTK